MPHRHALPTHPTLVHPVTGKPIRAIYLSPKTGKVWWPVIGGSEPPPTPPAPPEPPPAPAPPTPPGDPGYPANTPIEQMTDAQKAAYWQHHARKHEDRVKALGNLTPEQLTELQEKASRADKLEYDLKSDTEKQVEDAKKAGRDEAIAEALPEVVASQLDAAAARAGVSEEDLKAATEFVDIKKFLNDSGKVDTDKVRTFVASIKPAKGTPPKGPVIHGHGNGNRTPQGGSARERGLAEAQRRFGEKQKS